MANGRIHPPVRICECTHRNIEQRFQGTAAPPYLAARLIEPYRGEVAVGAAVSAELDASSAPG